MKTMLRSALAAIALIAASAANALALAPVKLQIVAGQHAVALTLTNDDSSTRTLDLRMYAWLGNDAQGARLGPQSRVLISRPVVTLAPGASSTVRIAAAERSLSGADYYRLSVNDITPAKPGEARLTVNFSLPLEVINARSAKGILTAGPAGVLTNTGTAAVFVLGLRRQGAEPDTAIHRYLLPGEAWATTYMPDQMAWSSGIL